MTSSIPELHYDLIARIVPGTVALAVFAHGHLPIPDGATHTALAFIAAYIVGFSIELVGAALIDAAWLDRACRRFTKHSKYIPVPIGDVWGHRNTTTGPRNATIFKMLAERSMFRSLLIISLIMGCVGKVIPELGISVQILLSLGFLNGFYWNSYWLGSVIREDKLLIAQQTTKT
jgi:hypothetical protein